MALASTVYGAKKAAQSPAAEILQKLAAHNENLELVGEKKDLRSSPPRRFRS
jgi:hypothetical protein